MVNMLFHPCASWQWLPRGIMLSSSLFFKHFWEFRNGTWWHWTCGHFWGCLIVELPINKGVRFGIDIQRKKSNYLNMAKCTKFFFVIISCDYVRIRLWLFFLHPSIWTISNRVFIWEMPYMYINQVLILLMINHGLIRIFFIQCLAMP
jgi:hypothetical protein